MFSLLTAEGGTAVLGNRSVLPALGRYQEVWARTFTCDIIADGMCGNSSHGSLVSQLLYVPTRRYVVPGTVIRAMRSKCVLPHDAALRYVLILYAAHWSCTTRFPPAVFRRCRSTYMPGAAATAFPPALTCKCDALSEFRARPQR
eukprot:2831585-Rhodomonas_salina.2